MPSIREYYRALRESEESTIQVDGFSISTAPGFKLSVSYLEARFDQFNRKYFNGRLERRFPMKIVRSNKFLGETEVNGGFFGMYVIALRMDATYNRSEFTFLNTLLHEMIHVYQAQVLFGRLKPAKDFNWHGDTFIDKLVDINTHGWKVNNGETDEEFTNRGGLSEEKLNYIRRNKYLVAFEHDRKSNVLGVFLIPKSSKGRIGRLVNTSWVKKIDLYAIEGGLEAVLGKMPSTCNLTGAGISYINVDEAEFAKIMDEGYISFLETVCDKS